MKDLFNKISTNKEAVVKHSLIALSIVAGAALTVLTARSGEEYYDVEIVEDVTLNEDREPVLDIDN